MPGGSDLGEISEVDRENYPNELRPFCKPPTIGSYCLHVYVRQLTILETHSGPRGPQTFPALSSLEGYLLVSDILYIDSFYSGMDSRVLRGRRLPFVPQFPNAPRPNTK